MSEPQHISSRDNPLLKTLRKLAHGNTSYRNAKAIWIEGELLCQAALRRGLAPTHIVCTGSMWERTLQNGWPPGRAQAVILPDRLFAELSALESPAGIGFVLPWVLTQTVSPLVPTVVLDQVQDAGNAGSILRSAAAFGFAQVLALRGTAALWSPKVLRAGMGAHFALRLVEMIGLDQLRQLKVPLLTTHPHAGEAIESCALPWPCAWVFGHEGQGVTESVRHMASRSLRVDQPGGEESLNVAACAAICLHASSAQKRLAPV